jgi:glycosyltransferase involved in cell wall biosynthesis
MDEAGAGLFVEPQNAVELAEKIIELSTHPALCELLGRNGGAHIVRHFSRQQTAAHYVDVLENLLKQEHITAAVAA